MAVWIDKTNNISGLPTFMHSTIIGEKVRLRGSKIPGLLKHKQLSGWQSKIE
jgi:hypothetical protein